MLLCKKVYIAQPQNMLDAKSRFYNNLKSLEGNEFLIKRSNHINVAKIYYNFILNARYAEDNKYCAINFATFSTAHSDCDSFSRKMNIYCLSLLNVY